MPFVEVQFLAAAEMAGDHQENRRMRKPSSCNWTMAMPSSFVRQRSIIGFPMFKFNEEISFEARRWRILISVSGRTMECLSIRQLRFFYQIVKKYVKFLNDNEIKALLT